MNKLPCFLLRFLRSNFAKAAPSCKMIVTPGQNCFGRREIAWIIGVEERIVRLDWIAVRCPYVPLAISVPADTPFLPGDLAACLMDARAKDNAVIACARSGGRTHPSVALWPVSIRNDLRHALVVEDMRKVEAFLQNYSRATVEWQIEPYDPFFNANDPSDLSAAEAILARRDNRLA